MSGKKPYLKYKLIGEDYLYISDNTHNFGKVPIIRYLNNDDSTGSFEKVLTLIDAYDLTVSDTLNNISYFATLACACLDTSDVASLHQTSTRQKENSFGW